MSGERKNLEAEIFKLPEVVELSAVTTAGAYILTSHLVRSLTKLDKFGTLHGDLAKSWSSSSPPTTWTIQLNEATFSNGESITADAVVKSIERQMRLKTAVHFPFELIDSVRALSADSLEIRLTEPRRDFPMDLAKPEFGVLHESDAATPKGSGEFKITSGPYRLSKREDGKFYLSRNRNYREDSGNELDLVLASSEGPASAARLRSGQIDFFTTQQSLTAEEHKVLLETSPHVRAVKPQIGFSFWISFNPSSPLFADMANRYAFQMLVHAAQFRFIDDLFWEKADQLYLPEGDGRPSAEALADFWSRTRERAKKSDFLSKKRKLRVLSLRIDNALTLEALELLSHHFEVERLAYSSEEELTERINSGEFEIKISSNDFSSADLTENLKTTFNSSRPYIFLGPHEEIRERLATIAAAAHGPERSSLIQQLGLSLLENGLIAPLAYLRLFFYLNDSLDLAAWSTCFPEISFWKVKERKSG